MWRYLYFILAIPNPVMIYLFSLASTGEFSVFSSYSGFFEENNYYYISLALYIPFALLLHCLWFGIQYALVRFCKAVPLEVYFRTKFWVAAVLPHIWGVYFLYSLGIGIPLAEVQSFWMSGSFWGVFSIFVFLYQFRVATVKNELSTT